MATPKYNTYVGMRYVPIFDGEWDRTKTYEPLTIVSYQGDSYTSRTFIPTGMDINNTDYWALTGNYNAQVEYYRQETARVADEVTSRVKEYNTVSDMINDADAEDGFVGKTLGYYAVNDGGGAYYNITETEPDGYYEELDNGLYATLIYGNVINVKQFGAKGDGFTNDDDAFASAFNEAESLIHSKDFNDHTPAQFIGGITVFIPTGVYVLTDTINLAPTVILKGEGKNSSIIRSSASYGISLNGKNYASVKSYRGIIEDIEIEMNGNGIGISNVEFSDGTATNPNAIEMSVFRNIKITNANVGFAMIGGWNNILENVEVETSNYGFILDRIDDVNGNNNNNITKCHAISCKACGFWLDTKGVYLENVNTEFIGNTWQGVYNNESVTILGVQYSVPNPCGIYLNGKCEAEIHSFWAERITRIGELDCVAILINPSNEISGQKPNGRVNIYSSHFNSDVYAPIKIASPCRFKMCDCDWPLAGGNESYFCYIEETTYGTYTFENIPLYLAENIVVNGKTTYNAICLKDIRNVGSQGNYNKLTLHDLQSINIIDRKQFKHSDSQYDVQVQELAITSDRSVATQVNGVTIEKKMYQSGNERMSFPANVKAVTVPSGSNTVTISSPVSYHDGSLPAGIILTARSSAGSQLLAGGYYWSGQSVGSHTVTLTFTNNATEDVVLDAFIFS